MDIFLKKHSIIRRQSQENRRKTYVEIPHAKRVEAAVDMLVRAVRNEKQKVSGSCLRRYSILADKIPAHKTGNKMKIIKERYIDRRSRIIYNNRQKR